ncbi:MAG: Uncharacterised protein [Cryomorphaceae bacterium]|nr:MAG: Uncharacterised protein [Cryomorphaceae bacterium]
MVLPALEISHEALKVHLFTRFHALFHALLVWGEAKDFDGFGSFGFREVQARFHYACVVENELTVGGECGG